MCVNKLNRFVKIPIFLMIFTMISGCAGGNKDNSGDNSAMNVAMTEAARKRVPDISLRADWCDSSESRCEITDVSLSPQGDLVALSTVNNYYGDTGPKIIIWNINTNKIVKVIEQLNIIFYSVEWSSDGRFLFAGGGCSNGTGNECDGSGDFSFENFSVWDTRNWARSFGMTTKDFLDAGGNDVYWVNDITNMMRSPNGGLLAIEMTHSILIYDIQSRSMLNRLIYTDRSDDSIQIMNWSPDSRYILSGNYEGAILFWDVNSGNKMGELKEVSNLGFAVWSPDGKQLASGSPSFGAETDFHCWNMATGALNWKLLYVSPSDASWSPDGRLVAIGQDSSKITIVESGTGDKKLEQDLSDQYSDNTFVRWSPDGTRLLAYGDHFGKVWDTDNWDLLQDNDVEYNGLRSIEWSPNGDFYLTWSAFGSKYDDFHLPHIDIWNGF